MSKKTKVTLANPVDVHVGMRVKSQRILLDMSQSELADELLLSVGQGIHSLPYIIFQNLQSPIRPGSPEPGLLPQPSFERHQ